MSDTLEDVDEIDEIDEIEEAPQAWVSAMAALGEDVRQFDPTYICVRRPRGGYVGLDDEPAVYAKKATLGDVTRIESIRWQTQLNLHRFWDRRAELCREVFKAGGECFIPVGAPSLYKVKGRMEAEYPQRVVVEKSRDYDGMSSHYDDDYWKFVPTKHKGTEMEVIAEAVEQGEWEQIILPGRVKNIAPIKFMLGRRWRHMEVRERRLRERCGLLNEMLKLAIQTTELISPVHRLVDRELIVQINGRRYPFSIRGSYSNVDEKRWPRPDDIPDVIVPDSFSLDESLVGKSAGAVRTRLGEPSRIEVAGRKQTWHYPAGKVVFNKNDHYPLAVKTVKPL